MLEGEKQPYNDVSIMSWLCVAMCPKCKLYLNSRQGEAGLVVFNKYVISLKL